MNEMRKRDREADEAARLRSVVTRQNLPDFVQDFELRFGEAEGEPAVWIVFHTKGDLPSDQAEADRWLGEVATLTNAVREQILDDDGQRFPYFRFELA